MSSRPIPPVRRLLMDAKALVAKPENWCKEADAKDAKGDWVGPTFPSAYQFCADGAVQRASAGMPPLETARHLLRICTGKRVALYCFNDAPETTHPMIIRLFNKAIKRAKEQGI